MEKAVSKDGTPIAFERAGQGPPLILAAAALCDRSATRPLAERLASRFTVFNYDRRGRGDSGDTAPYAVAREIEDLDALIAAAGGKAALYGHSSGAGLVLHAAAHGLPVTRLVLHEPPYGPDSEDERRSAREIAENIGAALAKDRRDEAIALFLGGAGMPPEMVEGMCQDPSVLAMAHTLAYEFEIMGNIDQGGTVPVESLGDVPMPALVLAGGASPEWMRDSARRIARTLPDGRLRVLEDQGHMPSPEVLAPVLAEFLADG
ncbi:alpha/beta fold hydrolase [Qaidamihabitans albus]|uniref:alpha/beta fold hydrolase n=1 Tax=Qaidamihabitans albus TaxID=2795733 RepID=UPI0018F1BD6A|nr:alpha/beta hydrolase [Qaidamihabitans albus]